MDADGMAVSLIQSNAGGFGSGLVLPQGEVFLHNRGVGFSLQPGHPAELAPGRRPPHTLAPLLVTSPQGALRGVLGGMGHAQAIVVTPEGLAGAADPRTSIGTAAGF